MSKQQKSRSEWVPPAREGWNDTDLDALRAWEKAHPEEPVFQDEESYNLKNAVGKADDTMGFYLDRARTEQIQNANIDPNLYQDPVVSSDGRTVQGTDAQDYRNSNQVLPEVQGDIHSQYQGYSTTPKK